MPGRNRKTDEEREPDAEATEPRVPQPEWGKVPKMAARATPVTAGGIAPTAPARSASRTGPTRGYAPARPSRRSADGRIDRDRASEARVDRGRALCRFEAGERFAIGPM